MREKEENKWRGGGGRERGSPGGLQIPAIYNYAGVFTSESTICDEFQQNNPALLLEVLTFHVER